MTPAKRDLRLALRTRFLREEIEMGDLRKALYRRLRDKGIEPRLIPGFLKIVADSLAVQPSSSADLEETNRRLHFLGWNDVDLDYHTLQLLIAALERGDSSPVSLTDGTSDPSFRAFNHDTRL
ncbi:MAG: hypothetical protein JRJ29_10495 [Deltaproteobacteria bacterium]|nr:hypothetical protein [Deltaproteobacteria bacterium]